LELRDNACVEYVRMAIRHNICDRVVIKYRHARDRETARLGLKADHLLIPWPPQLAGRFWTTLLSPASHSLPYFRIRLEIPNQNVKTPASALSPQ
jgi:hypothetical protein